MSEEMARTEAIEVLKDIVSKPMLYSNHIIGACKVALASLETDEAYQLEYERTTKNDLGVEEYVSRQAVDNLVREYLKNATDENIAFYEHFLDLPSVTPKNDNSVLEDIKAEIKEKVVRKQGIDSGEEYDYEFVTPQDVYDVIDKHISGKEE